MIVVDGRSVDGTVEVARGLRPDARIVLQNRRGKGNAMACGFAAVTGDIVVMLDADGSADPREIGDFVAALVAGADFAKGTRFADGGGSADITRIRAWGNRWLNRAANVLFGTHYTDLCYGYNAFWTHCLDVLGARRDGPRHRAKLWGDGFEIETIINTRVAKAGLRIVEVAQLRVRPPARAEQSQHLARRPAGAAGAALGAAEPHGHGGGVRQGQGCPPASRAHRQRGGPAPAHAARRARRRRGPVGLTGAGGPPLAGHDATGRSAPQPARRGRGGAVPLVALAALWGFDALASARHWPLVVEGALDEPAHLLTAWLLLAAAGLSWPACLTAWALAGSVLVDVDHVPLYAWGVGALMPGGRPVTHSLLVVLVLAAAATTTRAIRVPLLGLATGTALHLLRDAATGWGVPLLWPLLPVQVRVPHEAYLALVSGAALAAVLVRARSRSRRLRADAPPVSADGGRRRGP